MCVSVFYQSRDHFNHLCSIKGKVATTYILPHEAKIFSFQKRFENFFIYKSFSKRKCF